MFSGLSVLASLLAVLCASAALESRQSASLPLVLDPATYPASCQQICMPTINLYKGCSTIDLTVAERTSCYCTPVAGIFLKECLDCLNAAYPSQSQIDYSQSVLDWFNTKCQHYNLTTYSLNPVATGPSKPFPSTSSSPLSSQLTTPAPSQPAPTPFLINEGNMNRILSSAVFGAAAALGAIVVL